jgi:hypothetical protein
VNRLDLTLNAATIAQESVDDIDLHIYTLTADTIQQ